MGFDNEYILNIQSLPGEYFCPVCRTLVYPTEALQTQCTHVYCKPCLAYVVATTKACPYDGYLVTETDSELLVESNKPLAEMIGKVTVQCLYNKSGCQWQGTLSACITHGSTCAYGNSPVVCNRCGTQIVHRQVQEHAQLCPGVQSQTQLADSAQAQQLTGTVHAVTKDPPFVSSVGSEAAAATTVLSATTASTVTASSAATGGSAGATTVAAPPSFAGASTSAPQGYPAEHWYHQQYSQYYQQQYPGYNPYAQQYQQYGQYQQAYQQYAQPQMQVALQNVPQPSAQPAPVMQSSQSQEMTQSQSQFQSQHQVQQQASSGYPQTQQHQVQLQPQIQPSLPHQIKTQQPMHSAYQVLPMQQQIQVPLQLPAPQAQPTVHHSASTQVGNQQFPVPSTQATPHQIQPNVQAQPPQQQRAQLQALPQQQNPQPQMQLNNQIQQQSPQVQQQSYQQSQANPQPTPHIHPQTYPQQHMPPGAPMQPVHGSHQQGLVSQRPVPMRPPLPSQQLAVLPTQGIQHTPQHQQHAGYHAQRPPMNSSFPSQTPQQGLPAHSSVPSQAGQSFQQGMPSTQQQVHSHPLQPYGPPYAQQHVPGYGYGGQHIQSSANRPMNPAVSSSGPVNNLQASVMNQQPTAAHNTAISENRTDGTESSVTKHTMPQLLNDERMNGEKNDFGSGSKDVRTGVALDSADVSVGQYGIADQAGNSHALGLQGGKEHKTSGTDNNLEKVGSVQQVSQKIAGSPSAYPPPGMGPRRPYESDRMFHQHMMNSDPMPYNMQGQLNQLRSPKHSFVENMRPPMQEPYGSFHSGTAQRSFGENQIQSPMPHPAGIRAGDGMVRPPVVGPFPGHHDTMPPFVPDPLGRPHPPGTLKSNGGCGGPFVSGKAFHKDSSNASGEHLRSFAAHPGQHNANRTDIEDQKQFSRPAHLEMGPNSFERTLARLDGFPDRPAFLNQKGPFPIALHEDFARRLNATAGNPDFVSPSTEFDHHGTDGMPNLRFPGPFVQGMSGSSVNLPGNAQHAFDGPIFPHTRYHPGHTHPDDRNLVADYSLHQFAKEPAHFGPGELMRNTGVGWCRICMFNCGNVENLDLHVQTREHQQCAMDLVLKMKQDVAKRQKLKHGGSKSFHYKKVAGKSHFRGNRR